MPWIKRVGGLFKRLYLHWAAWRQAAIDRETGRLANEITLEEITEKEETMSKKLKLFVWKDVLRGYTAGVMFALAPDVETARKMLLDNCDHLPPEDLGEKPRSYTKPFALAVWGGDQECSPL